jgi:hypothetical protein
VRRLPHRHSQLGGSSGNLYVDYNLFLDTTRDLLKQP